MAVTTLRIPSSKETVEVAIDAVASEPGRCTATIGERQVEFTLERTGDGTGFIRIDGRVVPFCGVRSGDDLWLWSRDGHRRLEVVERTARRTADAAAAAASDELVAPMPGTVLQLKVTPGAEFERDETLVIMESMKMEMALSAPKAGRVAEVRCAVGDLVEMDAVLIRFEREEED